MRHLRRRHPTRVTAALFGLLAAAAAGGLVTTLVTSNAGAAPAKAAPPQHCVLRSGAVPAPAVCVATFRAAISVATGGRITDAPLDPRAALSDPRFTTRLTVHTRAGGAEGPSDGPDGGDVTESSLVLAIEYSDANFGGSTLTLTGATACDNGSDVDVQYGSLPSSWNDQISSFRGFNLCEQVLYRDVNFVAALTGTTTSTSWVGSGANDLASSIKLF
jgi:hypothetical protein